MSTTQKGLTVITIIFLIWLLLQIGVWIEFLSSKNELFSYSEYCYKNCDNDSSIIIKKVNTSNLGIKYKTYGLSCNCFKKYFIE